MTSYQAKNVYVNNNRVYQHPSVIIGVQSTLSVYLFIYLYYLRLGRCLFPRAAHFYGGSRRMDS